MFTVTPVLTGNSAKSWVVESSADADEFVDIPHGYGVQPRIGAVSPISTSNAEVAANRIAGWSLDMSDTVTIRVRKSTDAGSAGSRCLACINLPVFG
jgi:hypothetical protein